MSDDVSIVINGQQISGWESVAITRSAEMFPNSFVLCATDSPTSAQPLVEPGKGVCQVLIGSDLVITGRVDRYSASMHAGAHDVEINGRGICEDLVDCSADLLSADSPIVGGQVSASNALDLAQKLVKPFEIVARSAVEDLGKPIMTFQVALGERPYEIIERVARYAGYLIYEDQAGALVLDRVGTRPMASGFVQGANVEAAVYTQSVDQRFSDYCVVWTTIDQVSEGAGVNVSLKRAAVEDKAVKYDLKRNRPLIVVSSQTAPGQDLAQNMANWELARRIGRSQAVQMTCDSWRDSAGELWQPNRLAPVDLPALKLSGVTWIIGTVVFRKDMSGTHADLVLMPPDAFSVQPSTLNLWDNEIAAANQNHGAGPSPSGPQP